MTTYLDRTFNTYRKELSLENYNFSPSGYKHRIHQFIKLTADAVIVSAWVTIAVSAYFGNIPGIVVGLGLIFAGQMLKQIHDLTYDDGALSHHLQKLVSEVKGVKASLDVSEKENKELNNKILLAEESAKSAETSKSEQENKNQENQTKIKELNEKNLTLTLENSKYKEENEKLVKLKTNSQGLTNDERMKLADEITQLKEVLKDKEEAIAHLKDLNDCLGEKEGDAIDELNEMTDKYNDIAEKYTQQHEDIEYFTKFYKDYEELKKVNKFLTSENHELGTLTQVLEKRLKETNEEIEKLKLKDEKEKNTGIDQIREKNKLDEELERKLKRVSNSDYTQASLTKKFEEMENEEKDKKERLENSLKRVKNQNRKPAIQDKKEVKNIKNLKIIAPTTEINTKPDEDDII